LEEATEVYYRQGLDGEWEFDCADHVGSAFLRGRVTVTPEILVRFGGPLYVPLGTTLRQLLTALAGPIPRLPILDLTTSLWRQRPPPATVQAVKDAKRRLRTPDESICNFRLLDRKVEIGRPIVEDAYDLPLLAGDAVDAHWGASPLTLNPARP
jgi:hypothetical protein